MSISPIGEILQILSNNCSEFEAAVLYDSEGETIDYYSYLDPFTTRLLAAHHGILFSSLRRRLKWLDVGAIEMIELQSEAHESITLTVEDEYLLTIIIRRGGNTTQLHENLTSLTALLRNEIA